MNLKKDTNNSPTISMIVLGIFWPPYGVKQIYNHLLVKKTNFEEQANFSSRFGMAGLWAVGLVLVLFLLPMRTKIWAIIIIITVLLAIPTAYVFASILSRGQKDLKVIERYALYQKALQGDELFSVSDLEKATRISAKTIRDDLRDMHDHGFLDGYEFIVSSDQVVRMRKLSIR